MLVCTKDIDGVVLILIDINEIDLLNETIHKIHEQGITKITIEITRR